MEDHPSIVHSSTNNNNSSSVPADFHTFRFNTNNNTANITTMNLISPSDHSLPTNPNPNSAAQGPHHILAASTSFAIAPFQHHHQQSASERHLRSWDNSMAKLQTKPTANLLSQQQQQAPSTYLNSELQLIPNSALEAGNLIPSAGAPAVTYDGLANFGSRELLLDSNRVKYGYRAGVGDASGSSANDGDGSNLVSSNEEQQQQQHLGCTTSNLLGLGVSQLGSCAGGGFSTNSNSNNNTNNLPTTTTSEPRAASRFVDGIGSDYHHHQKQNTHHSQQHSNQYASVDMEILKVCQQPQPHPTQYAAGGGAASNSLNSLSLYDSDSCYVLNAASGCDGNALAPRGWPGGSSAQELLLLPRIEGGGSGIGADGASATPRNPLHFFDTMPPPSQPAASSLYRSSLHDKINVLNVPQVHRSAQPPAPYSTGSPFSLLKQQLSAGRHGDAGGGAAACISPLHVMPNLSPAYNTGLQSPPGSHALAVAGHHLSGHHDLSLFLQSPQQRQINLNAVLDTKLITSRTGSQTSILRNSKYLKPAQQLLNEFCSVQQLHNRENQINNKRSRSQLMMQDSAWSDGVELDGSAANNNPNSSNNTSNLLQDCSNTRQQSTESLMKTKTGLFSEINIRSASPSSYNSSAELELHDQYNTCRSSSLLGLHGLRDTYNTNNASDGGNLNPNMQDQHGSAGGGGGSVLHELMAVPASCGGTSAVASADQTSSISSSTRPRQLSAEERCHLQMRKVRLIGLVEELDRRYQQYRDHMQLITTSFESAMGLGAAAPYTSVRRKEVSRQFRGLRDAIGDHIRSVCSALGEDASGVPILSKGETPRLRILDQRLRHQRALHQIASLPAHHPHHHHQHAWRPQRGLPERSVSVLRAWLFEHFLHPYPKDSEKLMLARLTGLSRNQVANWFINARVRLWKPMVEEMYLEETKELEEQAAAANMKDPNNGQSNMDLHNMNSCNINAGGGGGGPAILTSNNSDPAKLSVLSARATTASARY